MVYKLEDKCYNKIDLNKEEMIDMMNDHNNEELTLFEYLTQYADEHVLTISEFASHAHISLTTLYKLKEVRPSVQTYRKLAKATGRDAYDLRNNYCIKHDE